MEIVIEGGILSALLLLLFGAIVVRSAVRAWPLRQSRAGREAVGATLIIFLCGIHSLVDYPLRRMGIAAVFFIALALLLRVRAGAHQLHGKRRGSAGPRLVHACE